MARKSGSRRMRDAGIRNAQQRELQRFQDNIEPLARQVKLLEQIVATELPRLDSFANRAQDVGVGLDAAQTTAQNDMESRATSALAEAQYELVEALLDHALKDMDEGEEDLIERV